MVNNLQVLFPHVLASSVDEHKAQGFPHALFYYLELVANILIIKWQLSVNELILGI